MLAGARRDPMLDTNHSCNLAKVSHEVLGMLLAPRKVRLYGNHNPDGGVEATMLGSEHVKEKWPRVHMSASDKHRQHLTREVLLWQ